jgi:hypothetical protein
MRPWAATWWLPGIFVELFRPTLAIAFVAANHCLEERRWVASDAHSTYGLSGTRTPGFSMTWTRFRSCFAAALAGHVTPTLWQEGPAAWRGVERGRSLGSCTVGISFSAFLTLNFGLTIYLDRSRGGSSTWLCG